MALKKDKSQEVMTTDIRELIKSGKSPKEAIAIAMRASSGKKKKKKKKR